MKVGILKEEKLPPDMRVPFSPSQCTEVCKQYPQVELIVQSSQHRCYSDEEYINAGIRVLDRIDDCHLLMGIKEVPPNKLIPDKTYLYFSHTIKKQSHNLKMLQSIVKGKNTLIDYETLCDSEGNRIIGFGRYAGIVGAYNGLKGYGMKYELFDLKPAHKCADKLELDSELSKVKLSNIKILVTGGGRVANGALEVLGALRIKKVTPYEFLNYSYREPVYCQLNSKDYHSSIKEGHWDKEEFYAHPEKYRSDFFEFATKCDLLITGHYWAPGNPVLFSKEQMRDPKFRISVIADITCDIDGSIPSTVKASSINEPFYGYNPETEKEGEAFSKDTITVMAVDNLPCELPRDASDAFGKELQERVLPYLFGQDNGLIERATIVKNGEITPSFEYLKSWVES